LFVLGLVKISGSISKIEPTKKQRIYSRVRDSSKKQNV